MTTSTETEVKTNQDAPDHWPPKAHIVHKKNLPLKKGTIALCGAKMMGIDLNGQDLKQVCKKCLEIAKQEGLR